MRALRFAVALVLALPCVAEAKSLKPASYLWHHGGYDTLGNDWYGEIIYLTDGADITFDYEGRGVIHARLTDLPTEITLEIDELRAGDGPDGVDQGLLLYPLWHDEPHILHFFAEVRTPPGYTNFEVVFDPIYSYDIIGFGSAVGDWTPSGVTKLDDVWIYTFDGGAQDRTGGDGFAFYINNRGTEPITSTARATIYYPVPEPGTWLAGLVWLGGLAWWRWRHTLTPTL